jgi:arylsulfatase A-like enzyme
MSRAAHRGLPGAALAVVLAAVLPIPLAFVAGCRRDAGPRYPGAPIVLISIDTMRADHLPLYGYQGVETPGFDALAADGVVFDNAYSHYPLTLPSHTSMLTGQLPPSHGVRDNVGYTLALDRQPFLPRLLAGAGYATGGFVSTFVLRPETGISAGFDAYDGVLDYEKGTPIDSAQRAGAATRQAATAWLRAHRSSSSSISTSRTCRTRRPSRTRAATPACRTTARSRRPTPRSAPSSTSCARSTSTTARRSCSSATTARAWASTAKDTTA